MNDARGDDLPHRDPDPGPPAEAHGGADSALLTLRRLLAQISGARMCFGDPVTSGGTTVVPVACVWSAGGAGFGRGERPAGARQDDELPGGGGGGGVVEARPVGFITISADGSSRYDAIPDPQARARAARLVASGAATLITAVAGARALRGATAVPRRRPALLRRGT